MRLCVSILGVLLITGRLAAADALPVATLAKALASDSFAQREAAEVALLAHGKAVLDRVTWPLPPDASDPDEFDAYVAEIERLLEAALGSELYDRLPAGDYESRFRVQNIRRRLDATIAEQLDALRQLHPARLPADQFAKLHGYTGGFRDGSTWFDAEFHNHSEWRIAAIRCLVRSTLKDGTVRERIVTFTDRDRPLLPGGQAKWSADVGFDRGDNYYWEAFNATGRPAPEEDKKQRIKRILEGGAGTTIMVTPRIIILEEDEEKLGIDLGP